MGNHQIYIVFHLHALYIVPSPAVQPMNNQAPSIVFHHHALCKNLCRPHLQLYNLIFHNEVLLHASSTDHCRLPEQPSHIPLPSIVFHLHALCKDQCHLHHQRCILPLHIEVLLRASHTTLLIVRLYYTLQ